MTDNNIVNFGSFRDQKLDAELDREEQADLWAERDALVAFIQRSESHANFAKWAMSNYAERVRDRSSQGVEWPFALHMNIGERSDTAKQFNHEWIGLAEEILTDLETVGGGIEEEE